MKTIACYPRDISYYPLPKRNVGKFYEIKSQNTKVSYVSPNSLPFGKWGDISAILISTKAKQLLEGQRKIEFDSVFAEVKRLGLDSSSGYKQRHIANALEAWTTLQITIETTTAKKKIIHNIPISQEAEIYYGDNKRENGLLLPNKSFILLSEVGLKFFTEKAIPIKAKDLAYLSSAFELRIYIWLIRKLYSIKLEPVLIRWNLLYEQFGPVPRQLRPRFRSQFKRTLKYIQEQLYPKSNFYVDSEEGIALLPSDPHIKPAPDESILVPSFSKWVEKVQEEAVNGN